MARYRVRPIIFLVADDHDDPSEAPRAVGEWVECDTHDIALSVEDGVCEVLEQEFGVLTLRTPNGDVLVPSREIRYVQVQFEEIDGDAS